MPIQTDELIDVSTVRVYWDYPGLMTGEFGIGAAPRDPNTFGPIYWLHITRKEWAPLLLKSLQAHAVEHGFDIAESEGPNPDEQAVYAQYEPDFGPPIFDDPDFNPEGVFHEAFEEPIEF